METQEQISQKLITPLIENTKKPLDSQRDRALQDTRRDDTVQNIKVGLRDIDEAILFYFNEVIRPIVKSNGGAFDVPVMYANPEKWVAAQKQGEYRDKEGKRQIPVILFKRESISRNKNITTKLDANRPHNFMVQSAQYSRRNMYSKFNILQNRGPEINYYMTVVPDYVKVDYSCIILTDYIDQMNKLVEAVNFASDSYWGDPEKFKFQAFIDSIKTDVQTNQKEDRTIKSTFGIKLNGYILPENVQSSPYVNFKRRNITNVNVQIKEEVLNSLPF